MAAPPPSSDAQHPCLPTAGQRRRLLLAGLRAQVARGRDFTGQALVDWQWIGDRDPYCQERMEDIFS
ncbi:hypothetical protein GCM10009760_54600 [Kitasatospora kazusensis]|uniref:Uncharacterized protein n=1 Tax=Kitasatospora kazusensis TaxID=407974 RepID=A0ABN3A7H1_9ACTN